MTLDEVFGTCLSRIELNPTRVALASQRYNAIKTVLEDRIPGTKVRQIGSFQRRTKIRPVNLSDNVDIDMVATIGTASRMAAPGESGTTPNKAFEKIQSALAGHLTYRSMAPRKDAPTVTLTYADEMSIEIVPAFVNRLVPIRPSGIDCYLIPNSSGWEPADYDYDANCISTANASSDGYLVPACKLMKVFFRNLALPVRSFYIELMCANLIPRLVAGWKNKYTWTDRHVFALVMPQIAEIFGGPLSLAGSHSPAVLPGLDGFGLVMARSRLKQAANTCLRLIMAPDNAETARGWAKLIGPPFPAENAESGSDWLKWLF